MLLQVSTYQMVVLLLFNESPQLSYREIAEATEIPPQELKRSLQSLACAKGEIQCAHIAVSNPASRCLRTRHRTHLSAVLCFVDLAWLKLPALEDLYQS